MANPTIVLVHGAFADASGFRGLYDQLLGEDVTVVAPPNPLRGLSGGDGEYIKAVVGEIDGPVLLVGHSYGGSVITAAGTADNVVGLVYISGFAPDEGENLTDLQSKFPAPGAIPYFRQHQLPEGGNEFTLAAEGFHESFCADIPADDAAFYAITQRPLAGVALTEAAPTPAWRSRPAWAVLGTADRCMGNSLAESRYTYLFSAHRGCGTFTIVIPAERLTWPRSATGWGEATAKRDLPVDVQFSLLGPVRAWRGPAEVDLGPNQQRALLALLLVRANQFVTTDDLMELLWERNPPGSAINVIHKYICAIRRLLEPNLEARTSGRWLTRQGVAYRLAADESTSDLIAFRRMVKDARSARAGDRPADALDLLMEALGQRRGACGEGLELYRRHRDYFTAVDQEYAAAVAEAADAALASAQPLRVLPLLRQVAWDEPLNESLQARLMLLLAATGQQALALSHYQAVRERLSDELGVDPGTEMRTAHGQVLRQELPTAVAGNQVEIASAPGSVRLPDTQAARISSPPGAPSPLVPPAQLPADLPTFAGREPELSQVAKMLSPDSESSLVAICAIDGIAGIGKTTFAIHWAHHVAKHFEDGQLYLNLHGFDSSASALTPADALGALLYSLGLPAGHIPDDLDARAGMYRSVLAGKHVLIVLDNARDVEQVRPLLPGSPGCLVIATSRNPLAGLAMTEGARLLTLKLPSVLTARESLERRLGVDRVAAEPEAVEEIIQLCGRLPLALAIVAARAAAHSDFTLASIATDLRRTWGRLDAFGTVGVAADARTVFSWSYRHLTPQACRLFRLLSLQPAADITVVASASLLGDAPETANRLMAELTSTALITEHQPGRYAFHELTRAYAAELSDSTDTDTDRHEALARLLDHYLHSSYAAQVELKPHREPIAPSPPLPGVTPEQFSDYASGNAGGAVAF